MTLLVHGFIGISDLLFSDIKESVRWSSDKSGENPMRQSESAKELGGGVEVDR